MLKNPIIVAVSGGFDPIHIGHVRLFQEAKKLGDKLVVILNNDNWLRTKKGHVFMPEKERKEVLEALSCVDEVVLTKHPPNSEDMSVCRELSELQPHIFANGGDRYVHNIPEVAACKAIKCKIAFNIGRGGKIQSSSWLLDKFSTRSSPKIKTVNYMNEELKNKAEAEDIKKCAYCRKECDLKKTLYKIRHERRLYYFCSQECKTEFQKKKFGDVIY